MFKILVKVGLVGLVAIGLIGCGTSEDNFIGKWGDEEIEITLMKASVCKAIGPQGKLPCEWHYDEKTLTLGEILQYSIKLDGNKLLFSKNGEVDITLTKIK